MRFKRISPVVIGTFFIVSPVFSGEKQEPSLEIIGKTQTFAAFNSFSGPGSEVKNLATSFDMSFFESNLGGKQSLFNGSGITTNSNFPLTDGEALTNNTRIGLSQKLSPDMEAGFLVELYSLIGDRLVGRTFGAELPWDNFSREEGLIEPPHFSADLYHGFLKGRHEQWSYQWIGGNLPPDALPELARKEMNQVNLGSLVYRVPVTSASFFSKEERRLVEPRHPVRGTDFIGDVEYAEKKHFHFEVFTAATEPTPVADLERDAYGGRAAVDIFGGNVGATLVYNEGLKAPVGFGENQWVGSMDASYKVTDWFIPYFTFARTDYEREDTSESHAGDAIIAGAALKFQNGYELKAQFQRLEENYDLMAYHKVEHYPGNAQGLNISSTLPLNDAFKIKTVAYYLEQVDAANESGDTIFGDSFFTSVTGSDKAAVGVERIGAEWKINDRFSLNGYVEHAQFRKNTPLVSGNIDKDVFNYYGSAILNVTKEFYVQGAFRDVFSVGNWQTMDFRSAQTISEAAVGCKLDKDRHLLLMYHYLDFNDEIGAAQGRNDYYGHQILFEVKTTL